MWGNVKSQNCEFSLKNTVTNDDNNYDNDAVDELTERRGKKDDRGDGVSETQRNEDH